MGLQNTLKALADPIRREILNMLKNGKMSAGEISDHFSVTAASISRHLSVLKEADLIRDQREGKFIFYELNASVLEEVILWIADLKGDMRENLRGDLNENLNRNSMENLKKDPGGGLNQNLKEDLRGDLNEI